MSAETVSKSFSELIKGDTPVLVDFYADWCMPCKMMTPILQEVKSRMGDALQIIKIDAEKNPAASIQYQVRGIPTLILFKKWSHPLAAGRGSAGQSTGSDYKTKKLPIMSSFG